VVTLILLSDFIIKKKKYYVDLQAYSYLTNLWQRVSFENRIKERKVRGMDGFLIR